MTVEHPVELELDLVTDFVAEHCLGDR